MNDIEDANILSEKGINKSEKKKILVVDDPISVKAEITKALEEAGLKEEDVEIISSEEAKKRNHIIDPADDVYEYKDKFGRNTNLNFFKMLLLPYITAGGASLPSLGSGSNSTHSKIWDGARESKDYDHNKKGRRRIKPKQGRNKLCKCGSGKKYKYCCSLKKSQEVQNVA